MFCYSTTQPAPHLDDVHVVFGQVVGGVDVVRQIEALPVDANSRPLQDVKIVKCGELVKQVKARKDKKSKDLVEVNDEEKKSKKKKREEKKKEKKDKKRKVKEDEIESEEEGEVKDLHPLATVTNINPEDIPDIPVNKFLLRGGNNNKGAKDKRNIDRTGPREGDFRGRRDWDNRNFNRRGPMTTKSGRMIKGRGKFRFRTPSRSRSRSATPLHWKKEESRVIKLSDFEKIEADRKRREESKKLVEKSSSKKPHRERRTYTPDNAPSKTVDYNALDYEDQSDEENEFPKKQVASLVQYPLSSTFSQSKAKLSENTEVSDKEAADDIALTKRSEFLAMALGVQVKTGKQLSNDDTSKTNNFETKAKQNILHSNLMKLAGQELGKTRNYVDHNNYKEVKHGRNKFETEKPQNQGNNRNYRTNGRNPDFEPRRMERRQNYNRPNPRSFIKRDIDRPPRDRRPRRSRSRERRRSLSQSRNSSYKKKSPVSERKKHDVPEVRNIEPIKKLDAAEEKYKKLLLIRQKVEFLEKKRKEEEKKRLEEKHRKVKEESEMLDKAKRAKREALEKEKLLKTYKVLQELDKRVIQKAKKPRSRSSSSSSSDSPKQTKRSPVRHRQKRNKRTSSNSSSRSRGRTPIKKRH